MGRKKRKKRKKESGGKWGFPPKIAYICKIERCFPFPRTGAAAAQQVKFFS
jgi:hypothetical protein